MAPEGNLNLGREVGRAWFWPTAVGLLLIQRLPYLFSPNRILDGDEAILGLMAVQAASGSELSFFFWGQSYGLSVLEVLPAALLFRVFGPGSLVLSLAMFGVFVAGLMQWERGIRNLVGDKSWSRVLVLGLALLPVWVIWSLKARGGYVTAFLLSGLLVRWVSSGPLPPWKAVATGVVLALLFFAQPVWLLPVLPLVLLQFLKSGKDAVRIGARALGLVGAGFATGFLPLFALASAGPAFWRPDVVGPPSLEGLLAFPTTLFHGLSGSFYLDGAWVPSWPILGVGVAVSLMWVFAAIALFRRTAAGDATSMILAGTLVLSVAGVAFLVRPPPRYFLQVSPFLALCTAYLLPGSWKPMGPGGRRLAGGLLLVLGASGSLVSGFRPMFPESDGALEAEIGELVQRLEKEGVQGVYSMDALLQWQVMFYGGERIPARFASPVDRRPAYGLAVDRALGEGKPVALIGTMAQAAPILGTPLGERVNPVGATFFYISDVERPLLESLGFRFRP